MFLPKSQLEVSQVIFCPFLRRIVNPLRFNQVIIDLNGDISRVVWKQSVN